MAELVSARVTERDILVLEVMELVQVMKFLLKKKLNDGMVIMVRNVSSLMTYNQKMRSPWVDLLKIDAITMLLMLK